MDKYNKHLENKYIFFSRSISLQPDTAHEIHDVSCANAAANLGYSSVLVFPEQNKNNKNILDLLSPFHCRKPDNNFKEFYDVQENLDIFTLPMPWPIHKVAKKWLNSSTVASKYYLPFHLLPHTKIVHTRDWYFARAAVKNKIPIIYERHYFQEKTFESEIVNSPYFQVAITQSEAVRESLIEYGMPSEKTVWLHNGFDNSFLVRQPEAAEEWRKELLINGQQFLVVYSGALYGFKGIEVLIDAAKQLPHIQFAITGGTEGQIKNYQHQAKEKQVENINFLGWILPRQRLSILFQAADVLAHPHCSGEAANFTNPVKFFQYMASGTPIAVTMIPPLMTFKKSPLIAEWCEPDDPYQFAECIKHTLDKYPRKVEGYPDSINLANQFTWEKRAERIISYVDESLRPKKNNIVAE
ncbi:MAG: glycosyltransferase [Scytonematopsis contorta HA4267-MV1]|jgi:glycosyltransferase involved in cell wall biosynthesis|nr:glycosyltransferase [Scytonematopsis contorta HA4267-MV1]